MGITMRKALSTKVLLIGWDGADWRIIKPLLEKGEMPNLERFVTQGVMGNLASLQPTLSPMIWTSIATGKLPDKHGVLGFTEVAETTGAVFPTTCLSRKAKAIWNILSQNDLKVNLVNWFAAHPAEPINGVNISPLFPHLNRIDLPSGSPLPVGTVHPADLSGLMADFLVRPGEIDSQTIALFVAKFLEVDQHNDRRLAVIADLLARCFSVHAAATWLMENRPWDFMAVYYQTIDNFSHGFMRYHPPRLPWINERDFAFYHDAVNSAYRLHDLMLGRLMELAGDDATIIICSDHGFQIGDQRPQRLAKVQAGPAEEHRPIGIIAVKGPGIKEDELLHGASVLDITPTVLTFFGLPVGRDMDGRPLLDAMKDPFPAPDTLPSWEEVDGSSGCHPAGTRLASDDAKVLLEQFVELGYVDRPSGVSDDARICRLEERWNLARIYHFTGRFESALPLLEAIHDESPLRLDFGLTLAECRFHLGLKDEAYEVMKNLSAVFPDNAHAQVLMGIAEFYNGRHEEALARLKKIEAAKSRLPAFYMQLGMIYQILRRTDDAFAAFQEASRIDPDLAGAYLGMARSLFAKGAYEEAAEAALQAIALEFSLSGAHFLLGKALMKSGRIERAAQAFEACLRFRPRWPAAHGFLFLLYGKFQGDSEKSKQYLKLLLNAKQWRAEMRARQSRIRQEAGIRAQERQAARDAESLELMAAIAGEDRFNDAAAKAGPRAAGTGAAGSSGREFVIVSGLPRSGTSLMMQMLAAAGLPPMTDAERQADEDNPQGYFEWEEIKRLARQPHIIEKAEGKAVKVVSLLLGALPPVHRYKVIFMRRPAKEIAASQRSMLLRSGAGPAEGDHEKMIKLLEAHQDNVLRRLASAPHADSLIIDYPQLIEGPHKAAAEILEFLGPERVRSVDELISVVKPDLYRQRVKSL